MKSLYSRHYSAALNTARQYAASNAEAEDIVAEAFARVIQAINNGKGPSVSLWWYLVTAMKSVAIRNSESGARTVAVEPDVLEFLSNERVESSLDSAAQVAVVDAFNRLPQRWQEVVWYREVQGLSTAETAEVLGLNPNSTSALHNRARKGFRIEYLNALAAENARPGCLPYSKRLPAYAEYLETSSDALSLNEAATVEQHLAGCSSCSRALTEIENVKARLLGVVAACVPGLVFGISDGIRDVATAGATSALMPAASPHIAGITTSLVAKAALGAAGLAVAAGITALFVFGAAGSAGEAQPREPLAADTSRPVQTIEPTAAMENSGEVSGESFSSAGPLVEREAGSALDTGVRVGRQLLVEVPTESGLCRVYFQQATGNEMAFFEQTMTGGGSCFVDIAREGGYLVMLDSVTNSHVAQAAKAAAYSIRVATDVSPTAGFEFAVTSQLLDSSPTPSEG
nr:sigma-70 family RNA polymerase sigma factor [Lysinibacter cavernae]